MFPPLFAYITQQHELQDIQDATYKLVHSLVPLVSNHDVQAQIVASTKLNHIPIYKNHFPLQFQSLGATIFLKHSDTQKTNISNVTTLSLHVNFSNPFDD